MEPAGEAPVYDLTEPVTHSLIANGLVAHNCGEIPLTVGEPCDLGAMNLAAYVKDGEFQMEEFRRDVRTAIRFLDNVLDVNKFALPDNEMAAKKLRRLGLGLMGLADALIKMGLPTTRRRPGGRSTRSSPPCGRRPSGPPRPWPRNGAPSPLRGAQGVLPEPRD